jgi:hypothetical protein
VNGSGGSDFASSLRAFAETLTKKFPLHISAQPEDQRKKPAQELLNVASRTLSRDVDARTKTHAKDVKGRPDIGGAVGGLLTGHIELKAMEEVSEPP